MFSVSSRVARRIRILAGLVLAAFFVGLVYRFVQALLGEPVSDWRGIAGSGLVAALVATLVGGFELLVLPSRRGERLRRQPFATLLLVRSAMASVLITIGLMVGNAFFVPGADLGRYLSSGQLLIDIGFSFTVSVIFMFVVQVRQIVGGHVFSDFVLGRYYRPVRERRLFMFLDLADSTSLAQELGDEGVHALITRFFSDVAGPVLDYAGETHRYVGDQVVVTWPYEVGVRDACCLRCVRAIDAELQARRGDYEQRFGVVPRYRIGLHGGSLVAGECGEDRREIVFFGDTVNTAARVQNMCKQLGHRVLVSGSTLADMVLPTGILGVDLGVHPLRGRDQSTHLYAVQFTERL